MSTKLEMVTGIIYDELGVLAGSMGKAMSERAAKKVVAALNSYAINTTDPNVTVTTPTVTRKPTSEPAKKRIRKMVDEGKIPNEKAEKLPDVSKLQGFTKKNDPRREERKLYVRMRREQGATLHDIAAELGVSRQRADQLIKQVGATPKVPVKTRAQYKKERREKLAQAMRSYLKENPRVTREQALKAVGVSDEDRRVVLDLVAYKGYIPDKRRAVVQKFTDEEIFRTLRRARKEIGGAHLSARAYNEWRTKADPSTPLMNIRFGSWNEACRRANVKHGEKNRDYTKSFEDGGVEAVLKRFINYCKLRKLSPSYNRYEVWQRKYKDAPSGTTIRKMRQYQRWNEIITSLWDSA